MSLGKVGLIIGKIDKQMSRSVENHPEVLDQMATDAPSVNLMDNFVAQQGSVTRKERDASFDAFRGLAIIAVVALHVFLLAGYWGPGCLFYCQLCNFPVPAFLFISGYWISRTPIKSLSDYKVFLSRRLKRVLVPYLFWSSLFIANAAFRAGGISVQEIIWRLLTGKTSFQYFFIVAIAQLYIITPFLHYINRRRYGLLLVLILNLISLTLSYPLRLKYNMWSLFLPMFYSWIIFYEIGLLTGRHYSKMSAVKKHGVLILVVLLVSLAVSQVEGMIILSKYGDMNVATHSLKYSSFLYSVCVILGFLFLRETIAHWPKLLVLIGSLSFGIYLIHVPILTRVVRVLKDTQIYSFPALYQVVVGLVTISISLAVISAARALLPKSFCRSIFGV
jgi:surface polysaccharide O-acyltransferase-like enzyme